MFPGMYTNHYHRHIREQGRRCLHYESNRIVELYWDDYRDLMLDITHLNKQIHTLL